MKNNVITMLNEIINAASRIDTDNSKVLSSKNAMLHYMRQAAIMDENDLNYDKSPDFSSKWAPHIVMTINQCVDDSKMHGGVFSDETSQVITMVLDLATIEVKRMMSV